MTLKNNINQMSEQQLQTLTNRSSETIDIMSYDDVK